MARNSLSALWTYLNRWTLRFIYLMSRIPTWYSMVPYQLLRKSDLMSTSKSRMALVYMKPLLYCWHYLRRQYRHKKVKHFSRDGSKITYVQKVHFDFDEDASAPYTQSDRIVALNMHMNVSMDLFRYEWYIYIYLMQNDWVLHYVFEC